MSRETYIPILLQLFRQYGYDGATLSKISEATGLGKASLYHYFPGGKEEMANAVLKTLEQWFNEHAMAPLRQLGNLEERLTKMVQQLNQAYENGSQPCLYAILMAASSRDVFSERIEQIMVSFINTIATTFTESGYSPEISRRKGEEIAIMIQGALVVSQMLRNNQIFVRTMTEMPQKLLRD